MLQRRWWVTLGVWITAVVTSSGPLLAQDRDFPSQSTQTSSAYDAPTNGRQLSRLPPEGEHYELLNDGQQAARWTSLPTDRSVREETVLADDLLSAEPPELVTSPTSDGLDLSMLSIYFRPSIEIASEWESKTNGVSVSSYDLGVNVPTLPVFGPPPPVLNAGFSLTDLSAPPSARLPSVLYDVTFGGSWIRPFSEHWFALTTLNAAAASDFKGSSSQFWQFRGGLLGIYRHSEKWQFIFGALATGRKDIPILPALGAVWQPIPALRFDLKLPQPKISWMFAATDQREHWLYLDGALSGGTWAYESAPGVGGFLTYREWRLVLGWESIPIAMPENPLSRGRKYGLEVGYVSNRKFIFLGLTPDLDLDDAILFRGRLSF